ncbi:hypothetical protein BTE77_02345 [Ensifer adhaerens]|nr:hypothetical protein BTE77_02345 [Ensifer adhaerens]
MPVRRRTNKRAADGSAWHEIFVYGFDMLNRAHAAGVTLNDRKEPDIDEARIAWQRYGRAFLASQDSGECWALDTFGRL